MAYENESKDQQIKNEDSEQFTLWKKEPGVWKKETEKRRLILLDEVRGLCVLAMVCYHSFYVLYSQFGVGWGQTLYEFFRPVQPVFAAMFILISGICSRLSRDVRRRGLMLTVISLMISLVTILALPAIGITDAQVWFGVLHLLAASMLLFALGRKIFDKIPALAGALICLALFIVFAPVAQGYLGMLGFRIELPGALYETNALFFLGFHKPGGGFISLDYFPLLPYCFLFLFGSFMGKFAEKESFPEFCYKSHNKPLGLFGRNSLAIYLLHVPVFYGLFYLARALVSITS